MKRILRKKVAPPKKLGSGARQKRNNTSKLITKFMAPVLAIVCMAAATTQVAYHTLITVRTFAGITFKVYPVAHAKWSKEFPSKLQLTPITGKLILEKQTYSREDFVIKDKYTLIAVPVKVAIPGDLGVKMTFVICDDKSCFLQKIETIVSLK